MPIRLAFRISTNSGMTITTSGNICVVRISISSVRFSGTSKRASA